MFKKIMQALMGAQLPSVSVIQDFLFVLSGIMDDGSEMDAKDQAAFSHQLMSAAGRSQIKNLALALYEFSALNDKPIVVYGDLDKRRQFHTAHTLSRLLSLECHDIAAPIDGLAGEPLPFQDVLHDMRFRPIYPAPYKLERWFRHNAAQPVVTVVCLPLPSLEPLFKPGRRFDEGTAHHMVVSQHAASAGPVISRSSLILPAAS